MNPETLLSLLLVSLQARSPFFGTLALFCRYGFTEDVPTAATDGRQVWFNPAFLTRLSRAEQEGLLLHELLHAALGHVTRRGTREPLRWNIACDVVVNGIVRHEPGVSLPAGAIREPALEHLDAEEVYAVLQQRAADQPVTAPGADLLPLPDDAGATALQVEAGWRQALAQAAVVARAMGRLPAGVERLVRLGEPRLDWRAALWRFLARTPVDFDDWDRRHLHRGLYLETLAGLSLTAAVCVDTSGSIDNDTLGGFLAEVRAIASAYPSAQVDLFYADAELHGPFPVAADRPLAKPRGGGGTDFRPFLDHMAAPPRGKPPALLIYLTDGLGIFPKEAPPMPLLWVVTPGGAANQAFPFGEVVRMT